MAWTTSNRKARLPRDWQRRRAIVLARAGHRCEWEDDGVRCPRRATDCDHVERGDDHRLDNLQALCRPHHSWKSAHEGGTASAARRGPRLSTARAAEPHPGLRPPGSWS
ncbi:hypothetical protein N865_02065 [Intrasporangium oryzae NRRL B-24470]|uniref:HNH endonuclease n=1 Tax=Intrasporangium oryzae NRRL B-24470 TaxID=1386089 RepID=W9G6S3_9MICO|nr:hypothetical protein N865_02065 [Intrasporangium oryzae NRRL B-24470]